ncbi:50S ribosomal protein L31 chloroplastic [Tripterygium wilfordii]|uniref:50S ribosomal protein L31 n=1 Tax=Tripterygium wilfordii TaxID=458696 RepID=A0A7J7DL89_TRIWF|nr:50S ribosomal protein L31, chloroplastic-like [Tripterygium wilfordii]KAF5747132.1 50S ribosomal protein L31 chloroplastic [Tripterygium wilfordii]
MALTLPNSFLQIKPSSPSSLPVRKVVSARAGNHGMQVTCRKRDIHPQFHEDAKVYCNGELVMTTGGTQKEYVVDVWSGNHPFYLGSRSAQLVDADQVAKFRKRFAGLPELMEIPVLKGEIVLPSKRISISKKGASQKKK